MSGQRRRVLILGGGISGIALASELDEDVEIVELRERTGGLCETIVENGFTYDAAGPHIMFSKNKAVLQLMVAALGKNVHQKKRENKIWFKGRMVRYPFENDLAALPPEDNFECIHGYLANPRQGETPTNLAQWSYVTFGKGISEKYFIPYNEKIWNYDANKIGLEFVSRIPKPPLEDVLRSSIGIPTEGYLHQLYFSYPIEGGFEAIVDAFAARMRGKLRTGWRVARVERDGAGWCVTSASGEEIRCDTLVSTIPIHELLKVWPGAPDAARAAAGRLRWNSLINVVIGSAEPPSHGYTAVYVPEPEILFHRVSFPHAFSERCAPEGSSIAMAEITANDGDGVWEMSDEALLTRVTADLERAGLVTSGKVSYRRVVRFQYGYPVYDLEYRHNVTELREAVASTGLRLLGRFAQFDYINSDVCVERALAMATELRRA